MRICEHCGSYMSNNAVHCTICGVAAVSAAEPTGQKALTCVKCDHVFEAGEDGLPDPSFYTNPYQLAEINSRLRKDREQAVPTAPYTLSEVNKYVPAGPTYVCRNCNTINSIDDTYCVVCGAKVSDRVIRDVVRNAKDGRLETITLPPETALSVPQFGRSTDFSTSLNTLEAALKPYIYNITGNNNIVNNTSYGGTDTGKLVCPYAGKAKEADIIDAVESESAEEAALTQAEIDAERQGVLKRYKNRVHAQSNVGRQLLAIVSVLLTGLLLLTFFLNPIPYTQEHDMNRDQINYEDSTGADIVISTLTILHFDDLYDGSAKLLKNLGVDINAAYYRNVIMEVDRYTTLETILAHSVPITLIIAIALAVLNIVIFGIKMFTGSLKKKFYMVTALLFLALLVAAAEIFVMGYLMAGVFTMAIGYGLLAALFLAAVLLVLQKFCGKRYPKSERERIKSLYGY